MAACPTLERVTITGGQGFLGAYVIKDLLARGAKVEVLDLKTAPEILEQVLSPQELSQFATLSTDIADAAKVKEAVLNFKPTSIIHLAGVQIPTVRANPAVGVAVNVLGTVNVFEAVKALASQQGAPPIPVAYASSGAVLGPSSDYAAGGPLPAERDYHRPRTLYGVFKLCNEGTARIYWQDHEIPSVGLRPLTIFGVGREIGLTSGPTKAVKAAVLGRRFMIEVSGVTGFHHAADVAALFIDTVAGVAAQRGAHVCGMKGHLASYQEFLKEAAKAIPEVGQLAYIKPDAPEVPIHGDVDEAPLHMLTGRANLHMSLTEAVAEMATRFKDLKARGMLHDKDLGPEPPPVSKL
jgi:nucleoside-diphosphate-sugar epimerase